MKTTPPIQQRLIQQRLIRRRYNVTVLLTLVVVTALLGLPIAMAAEVELRDKDTTVNPSIASAALMLAVDEENKRRRRPVRRPGRTAPADESETDAKPIQPFNFQAPKDSAPALPRVIRKKRPPLPAVDFSSLKTHTAFPSRWDIVGALGYPRRLWDPYHGNNPLKADMPIYGKDWFFNLGISSITRIESRYFPVPVGNATTANPSSLNIQGDGKQQLYVQNLAIETVLYKGDTVFRPPDYEFRFTPVINFNNVNGEEKGVLNVDPTVGEDNGTDRSDDFMGIQALFADVHLRNVSDRYDFDSIRFGIQPFTADFRGFLFADQPFGVRLFGTRKNNVFQYNLAWFRRIEKDTNSGLNDIGEGLRKDDVYVANVYWQDMLHLGLTTQFSFIHNRNAEKGVTTYDNNGFITRPASLFDERSARDYNVSYFGWSNDGHIDRINISSAMYYAIGSGTSEVDQTVDNDISALFLALETSYDIDWIRLRFSYLYASGDSDPYDDVSQGFDAIFENPLFAGADASYYINQSVPLIGGGGVSLSGRNGLLNSLRSSKEQGQSNFTNPGLILFGLGADFEILPELKAAINLNQLSFDDTAVLEALRQQAGIANDIGMDISLSLEYRPWLTQNFITSVAYSQLIPGDGYKSLYADDETPFAFTVNLILNY